MPELPEVEVVKRSLRNNISNLTIKKVEILTNKLRYKLDKKKFNQIKNNKIISIERRSKYLLIFLKNKYLILAHLGMTGKFFFEGPNKIKKKTSFYYEIKTNDEKHNHLIFYFNENKKLIYNDIRKFGFLKILLLKNYTKDSHLSKLGPEPLSKKFNFIYFKKFIEKRPNRSIKNLLMDQKFVSGLGNIYVNELLFLCGLSPKKRFKKINNLQLKKIVKFTKKILIKSIKNGGSSIKDFNDANGQNGKYQQSFKVYSREGKKCLRPKCIGIVKKIFISNRSSFYCSSCQK